MHLFFFPLLLKVADIEEKLDILIKAYMQDRERFLALPLVPDSTSHSINNKNPPNPPPPPCGGILTTTSSSMVISSIPFYSRPNVITKFDNFSFQPKPILVEKQFSEPNSPITKTFESVAIPQKRPPMHRGYSDLGNRIKKRVTLRLVNSSSPISCWHSSHTQMLPRDVRWLNKLTYNISDVFPDLVQSRPNMLAIIQFNMMDVVMLW